MNLEATPQQLANYKSSRFMRLPCTPGRNAGGEDRTNEQISHNMQWPSTDRDTEIVGHVPYNLAPRMSAFYMRDTNKTVAEITGATKSTGKLAMVWKSHVSTVYMDLLFMLTKRRSSLSLFLLMDIIICVIETLLNDNWHFKIKGCGQ